MKYSSLGIFVAVVVVIFHFSSAQTPLPECPPPDGYDISNLTKYLEKSKS